MAKLLTVLGMMLSFVRTVTFGWRVAVNEENADSVTPDLRFLVKVTQASGHQFDIEECQSIVVEVGPDIRITITKMGFHIGWIPTGAENYGGAYSWMRLIVAMIRGRLREDN
jgi:hypothetical protein